MLQRLRDQKLFAKLSNCHFCKSGVDFLGHVVSADGIGMDKHKVQAVQNWPQPRTVKDIMQLVGLASYYRRFVKSYAVHHGTGCWRRTHHLRVRSSSRSHSRRRGPP